MPLPFEASFARFADVVTRADTHSQEMKHLNQPEEMFLFDDSGFDIGYLPISKLFC